MHGYCKRKGITRLLIDFPLPDEVANNETIRSIIKNYEVITLSNKQKNYFYIRIIRAALNPIFYYFLFNSLFINRRLILEFRDKSWFKIQLMHALWDSAMLRTPDGFLNPPLIARIKSALILSESAIRTKKVIRHKIVTAFYGHAVYGDRVAIALLRQHKINIYVHSLYALYELNFDNDSFYCNFRRAEWNYLLKNSALNGAKNFWNTRKLGESSYEDARNAAKNSGLSKLKPVNVVMLHIFRDSPFNNIDKDRIFADYVDWVRCTLSVLKNSKESWLIKKHPSADRWGENQDVWLQKLIRLTFKNGLPSNINIVGNEVSNIDIFLQAKRIVTFRGTAHLEAFCHGIRPIVISSVVLSSCNEGFVLKPKTMSEYSNWLLRSSDSDCFLVSNYEIELGIKILYLREVIVSLNSDVGGIYTYRGDAQELIKKDIEIVSKKISAKKDYLMYLGDRLASGIPHTYSEDHINLFNNEFPTH